MPLSPVDGPALQDALIVTDSAIVEVKVEASPMEERKIIMLQPLGGRIRVFFAYDDIIPSVADVKTKGFLQFKNSIDGYETSKFQRIFIVSENIASQTVIIVERA